MLITELSSYHKQQLTEGFAGFAAKGKTIDDAKKTAANAAYLASLNAGKSEIEGLKSALYVAGGSAFDEAFDEALAMALAVEPESDKKESSVYEKAGKFLLLWVVPYVILTLILKWMKIL